MISFRKVLEQEPPVLWRVAVAYRHKRVAQIRYRTPYSPEGRITDRDIEIHDYDETSVDAYCRLRSERRIFRLDRILRITLLHESFSVRPEIIQEVGEEGLIPLWVRLRVIVDRMATRDESALKPESLAELLREGKPA